MEQPPAAAGIQLANWYWRVVRQFVSERFGISLCRSSCLNWLYRLGFACNRPTKRLLKANESKREAFVAEYAALWEEAQRTEASIFFADEAHFRADAELRGKWVLKGKPALVDSNSPRDRRQLVLPVATTIFAGRDGVIIRYGGTVDYRPTNQAIEAETYGRQDTGNGSGQGWDERAFSAQVAERPIAVAGETGASVAHSAGSLRRGVGG